MAPIRSRALSLTTDTIRNLIVKMTDDRPDIKKMRLFDRLLGQSRERGAHIVRAARHNQTEYVQGCIADGDDVNAKDEGGITALMEASANGNLELVHALVERGAKVNAKGNAGGTALIVASVRGHGQIVSYLLDNGANVRTREKDGFTALHSAATLPDGPIADA